MTVEFSDDFVKFISFNHDAQKLFSRYFIYAQENDTFHRRLINDTGSEPSLTSDEVVESFSDYDTHADIDSEDLEFKSDLNLDYYVLSFNEERVSQFLSLFRDDREKSELSNRDVDLLLTKSSDIRDKFLVSVHLTFRFNLKSGFLMLREESLKVSVEITMNDT